MTALPSTAATPEKEAVRAFWDEAACGEVYAEGPDLRNQLEQQAKVRYQLEPFIFEFAQFSSGRARDVLEIGVGMGADHLEWAKANPRSLTGVDLTPRAVELTRARLGIFGFTSDVRVADAEALPFASDCFDIVYSWGVLHHSPDTKQAVSEVHRVLRRGGTARVMIYHRHSIIGALLWLRYGLLRGRPFVSLHSIYSDFLESPGTKAYTRAEARKLFAKFANVKTSVRLSPGDLMEGAAGQRHAGAALSLARQVWPRAIIRKFFEDRGLFLLIEAVK